MNGDEPQPGGIIGALKANPKRAIMGGSLSAASLVILFGIFATKEHVADIEKRTDEAHQWGFESCTESNVQSFRKEFQLLRETVISNSMEIDWLKRQR